MKQKAHFSRWLFLLVIMAALVLPVFALAAESGTPAQTTTPAGAAVSQWTVAVHSSQNANTLDQGAANRTEGMKLTLWQVGKVVTNGGAKEYYTLDANAKKIDVTKNGVDEWFSRLTTKQKIGDAAFSNGVCRFSTPVQEGVYVVAKSDDNVATLYGDVNITKAFFALPDVSPANSTFDIYAKIVVNGTKVSINIKKEFCDMSGKASAPKEPVTFYVGLRNSNGVMSNKLGSFAVATDGTVTASLVDLTTGSALGTPSAKDGVVTYGELPLDTYFVVETDASGKPVIDNDKYDGKTSFTIGNDTHPYYPEMDAAGDNKNMVDFQIAPKVSEESKTVTVKNKYDGPVTKIAKVTVKKLVEGKTVGKDDVFHFHIYQPVTGKTDPVSVESATMAVGSQNGTAVKAPFELAPVEQNGQWEYPEMTFSFALDENFPTDGRITVIECDASGKEYGASLPFEYTISYAKSNTADNVFQAVSSVELDDKLEGNVFIKNKAHTIEVNKKATTGEDELPGAVIQILSATEKDEQGNPKVIEQWTSTDKPYTLTVPLLNDTDYILRETVAPEGYLPITTDTTFKVRNDGTVYDMKGSSQVNVDEKNPNRILVNDAPTTLKVSKTALTGQAEIPGAKFEILEGTEVKESWTSTSEVHEITGKLKVETDYTLRETEPPAGYILPNPSEWTFKIERNGTIDLTGTNATLVDGVIQIKDPPTVVKVSKCDVTNDKELEGAHIQILDADGNLVHEWNSSANAPEVLTGVLEVGKTYTLRETVAPAGYMVTTDTAFALKADGTIDTDKTTARSKSDTAADGNGSILLVDDWPSLKLIKVDAATGSPLSGATLEIKDESGAAVIPAWVTDGKEKVLEGLMVGRKYTLSETNAPQGYGKITPVTFSVVPNLESKTFKVEFDGKHDEVNCRDGVLYVLDPEEKHFLTVTKNLLSSAGQAKNGESGRKFYAAIYEDENFTRLAAVKDPMKADSYGLERNLITLDMSNKNTSTVQVRVYPDPANPDVTYYVTEVAWVDETQSYQPVSNNAEYAYIVTYGNGRNATKGQITRISENDDNLSPVILNNQEKPDITPTPPVPPSYDKDLVVYKYLMARGEMNRYEPYMSTEAHEIYRVALFTKNGDDYQIYPGSAQEIDVGQESKKPYAEYKGLPEDTEFYVFEINSNNEPILYSYQDDTEDAEINVVVQYDINGIEAEEPTPITMTDAAKVEITNKYDEVPKRFMKSAELYVDKKVVSSSGNTMDSQQYFYVNIYYEDPATEQGRQLYRFSPYKIQANQKNRIDVNLGSGDDGRIIYYVVECSADGVDYQNNVEYDGFRYNGTPEVGVELSVSNRSSDANPNNTTEIRNEKIPEEPTKGTLSVTKSIKFDVEGYDPEEERTFRFPGDETFYIALFMDSVDVNNIVEVKEASFHELYYDAQSVVTFGNLDLGTQYFVAEVLKAGDSWELLSAHGEDDDIKYTAIYPGQTSDDATFATIDLHETNQEYTFDNEYFDWPQNFFRGATIQLTKNLTDADGNPIIGDKANQTFYAGIFEDEQFTKLVATDGPRPRIRKNIIPLDLNGENTKTEPVEIALYIEDYQNGGNPSLTFYVTEVTEDGTPVKDMPFPFKVLYGSDRQETGGTRARITVEAFQTAVTITNQEEVTETPTPTPPVPGDETPTPTPVVVTGTPTPIPTLTPGTVQTNTSNNITSPPSNPSTPSNTTGTTTTNGTNSSTTSTNSTYSSSLPNGTNYAVMQDTVGAVSTLAVKTGDDTPIALYVGILAAAAVIIVLVVVKRRKK